MSTFRTILFCFVSSAIAISASAQVPPQFRAGVDQILSNVHSQMFQNTPRENYARINNILNIRHNFYVMLKDSTEVLVNSKIHVDTVLNKSYLLYTDKKLPKSDSNRTRKIFPETTVSITRKGPDIGIVQGFSNNSYWLFRILEGKISLYSMLSDTDQSDSTNFVALQIDGGPIEPWNAARLYPYMKQVEKAHVLYAEREYFKAIKKYNKSF